MKGQTHQEEIKQPLFTDNMIMYAENSKVSKKKKKKNKDFPGGTVDRKLPANAGDPAL